MYRRSNLPSEVLLAYYKAFCTLIDLDNTDDTNMISLLDTVRGADGPDRFQPQQKDPIED